MLGLGKKSDCFYLNRGCIIGFMVVSGKNTNNRKTKKIEDISIKLTNWVGTTQSIIVHTLLFLAAFSLIFLGINVNYILLVVTTAVSLEAIYLALFIQMTVNRNSESLEDVEENIDEIQEDVKELEENVDDIEEDVDEITEDIDKIQEEEAKEEKEEQKQILREMKAFDNIESQLVKLVREMDDLQKDIKLLKTSRERGNSSSHKS